MNLKIHVAKISLDIDYTLAISHHHDIQACEKSIQHIITVISQIINQKSCVMTSL